MARKLFCEISPLTYEISLRKEIFLRTVRDLRSHDRIARTHSAEALPNIVKSHSSVLVRRLHGVDIRLQENKVTNIRLACEKVNGLVIRPGETFSYWKTLGEPTRRKGYKEGLAIRNGKPSKGVGGGLCQMANMIHWLVLNSPLEVTELHHHSDALFPDERRRVPFGTGTSVFYNKSDYRFRNNTDQNVQILVWVEDGELCGELRSERPFPYRYKLVEEDHHFKKEGEKFYRNSRVYRIVIDRATNEPVRRELLLNNHSEVMYDYSLIPEDQIRTDESDT
ncbi:MAG: VanW family protein [Clostridia bacterium]|nr:VanW family protein [Clostridia bacterium]